MAEIRKYVAAFTNYHIHYAKVYLYTFIRRTLRTPILNRTLRSPTLNISLKTPYSKFYPENSLL